MPSKMPIYAEKYATGVLCDELPVGKHQQQMTPKQKTGIVKPLHIITGSILASDGVIYNCGKQ